MVNAYHMHKLSLESNKLSNVNFLSQMYQNRSLLELELIDQRFVKEKPPKSKGDKESSAAAGKAKESGEHSSDSEDSDTSNLEVVPID